MDYNLFQKTTVGKKGKAVKKWYYWYIDGGVQKQRVCKGCATKAEAVAFINSLPPLRRGVRLVREVAENMYLPGSEHVKRRAAFGRSVVEETLRDARIYIDSIIETWGDYDIRDIDVQSAGNYLISVERSSSWKKRYISIFGEIFDEAVWNGMKIIRPSFPRFTKKTKKSRCFFFRGVEKTLCAGEFFRPKSRFRDALPLFSLLHFRRPAAWRGSGVASEAVFVTGKCAYYRRLLQGGRNPHDIQQKGVRNRLKNENRAFTREFDEADFRLYRPPREKSR